MRGLIPALRSPHPLGPTLPALYQEDEFAQRFVSAFDEALAPVFAALDGFESYLDPELAPADFVEWLARWVAVVIDESWSLERKRAFVAHAVGLYRLRGTARGLIEHVSLFTGVEPDLEETGGVTSSIEPGQPLPGKSEPKAVVRLRVDDPKVIDRPRLDALIAAIRPAHLPIEVEVVAG
ncbi:MAG: phage tail protein [Gaiellaceae bacterium]